MMHLVKSLALKESTYFDVKENVEVKFYSDIQKELKGTVSSILALTVN